MYVYKVEFTRQVEQVDPAILQAHLQRLDEAKQAGVVIFGGAFTDGSGGMTLFHAENMEKAKQWVEQDAYVKHNTHSWNLKEINRRF